MFGIASLIGASTLAQIIVPYDSTASDAVANQSMYRVMVLVGLIGVTSLWSLINYLKKHRKKTYAKHSLIGIWMGFIAYWLIFIGGLVGYFAATPY